jgi:thioester reductase-like protein
MSLAIRQAAIQRMIRALESTGHPVKAVRLSAAGEIEVLTGEPSEPQASNDSADWTDLAGETALPRAQRA